MSTIEGALGPGATELPAAEIAGKRVGWLESWLVRAGDRLNPILVKETRQAFKSRQFTVTFGLLLLADWLFTLLWALKIGPSIYYGAYGPEMFVGYYVILTLPLLVVVPFTAFRSVAGEREDGTYELLSITTLSSRQVVSGKLGSAVFQMLIYASAISPCLAFTYLLRGIELPAILTIIAYTLLGSIGLSLFGLFFATLTGERHWQVVLSVLLICGLLFCCWMFIVVTYQALYEDAFDFREAWFWYVAGMILSAYLAGAVSVFLAACAQINFASSNRSTALRVASLGHCLLFAAWISFLWIFEAKGEIGVLAAAMCMASCYWFGMGALMTGEDADLSLRVRRQLPQTFFGRVFLTWLSPGPGTGYILAVSSLLAQGLTIIAGVVITDYWHPVEWRIPGMYYERTIWMTIMCWSYVTLYLGAGRGLIGLARRISKVSPHTTLLVQILLIIAGMAVPLMLEFFFSKMQARFEYSILHASNPMWTLFNIIEGKHSFGDMMAVQIAVPMLAMIVLLLNFPSVAEEVRRIRIAAPARVIEEDAQVEALLHPAQPTKTNPWD